MEDNDLADENFKAGHGPRSATSPTNGSKGNLPDVVQNSRWLTHSCGGGPLIAKNKGRKNRRDYPSSWGFNKGQMNMKNPANAIFDSARR